MFTTILILLSVLLAALGIYFALKFTKKIAVKNEEESKREKSKYYDTPYDDAQDRFSRLVWGGVAAAGVLGTALFLFFGTFYTQDPGESKVLVSFDGTVVGEDTTAGAGFKAPWVELKEFDIRNQQVLYAKASSATEEVPADGPQITVQDKEGVSANVDISVRYSIKPDAVNDIYTHYLDQELFKSRFIEQTVRSVVRELPGKYTTLELLSTKRGELGAEVQKKLEAKFEAEGVLVDAVNIQEIRYPKDVKQRFADAQNARTEVEKAKAELDAATISAQKVVVTATAEAEANNLLTASLSPQILQNRYLEALKEGTVYVVPDGSTPFIGTK